MINQVFLAPSSPWTVTGPVEFDTSSAHLKLPQGTSFPSGPETGDYFFRTDLGVPYRYNGATWVAESSTPTVHALSHQPGGGDAMAVDAAASTGSLRTIGTGALQACAGNDARLSDSRTPSSHNTSHKHGGSDEVATATASANVIPKAGAAGTLDIGFIPLGATSSTACAGNDSRLSDARTPTTHHTSHEPGGGDALAVDAAAATGSLRTIGTGALQACAGNDARLSDSRTPTAHKTSHQNGGSDEVATATAGANAIPKANASAKLDIGWVPTGATSSTVCIGNDSRLSDARTPITHATSHQSGGGDAIKLDDLATPDDNTDLNATTGQHGLLPKLGGGTTNYLRADGTWASPAAPGSFGQDYTSVVSEGTSTTTSATYQDKVTLTTGAWTGTYLIQWQCEIMTGSANTRHQCRLYDVTNATELDMDEQRPSAASLYTLASGYALVTLAGAATTYKIQFASQGGSATITIRRARAIIWRVA